MLEVDEDLTMYVGSRLLGVELLQCGLVGPVGNCGGVDCGD